MEEVSEDRVKEYINAISIYKCKGEYSREENNQIDKELLKNCVNFYEAYKKEKSLLDFEDLQLMCRYLFNKNSSLLNSYQNQFKHILVDEFQDSDDVQVEILKLLNKNNNLFVVGDEDQCIYSFRGANPSYIVNFKEIFKNGKTLYLSTNYRSRKNIVSLSMKSIKNNKIRTSKNIKSNKIDEGLIKVQGVRDEIAQGTYISDYILKLKETENYNFNNFAVLYRTNIESRSIIDSFIRKRIPFTLLDRQYNFFSHFVCEDILAYLKLSIYPLNMDSFIRIINKPYRYISKNSIEKVKKSTGLGSPFGKLKNLESIPVFQLKIIDKLEKDIASLNKMSLSTAVDFIIGDLLYHKYLVEYSQKYKLSIEDLENVLNEFKESVKGFKNIKEFLEHVNTVEEETKKAGARDKEKNEGVILSTIHGVKGMEFDTVFMINAIDGFIPYKNNDIEEERRLFYVGVTRAINNVVFLVPQFIMGENRNKSQFLSECEIEEEILERVKFKVGTVVLHKFYGRGIITLLDESNISIKFSDLERKFDFDVLISNGLMEIEE